MKKRGREKFKKFKSLLKTLAKAASFLPKGLQLKLLKWNINTQGTVGLVLRYIFFYNLSTSCGDNVAIHPGVFLFNIGNIEMGDNVSIHPMCYFDGKGGLKIGSDVSIAHGTSILTTEHLYTDYEINIKDQGVIEKETILEDNVWVGAGVKILSGSVLRKGVIIAAGAVVNGDTTKNTIYGGIPYRKIKER